MLQNSAEMDFFSEYGDANRYKIQEVIGKGSYGVVCSAIDTHTGEKVAIKKIHDIFEHISDAARILREIKLLRLLRHPDIVEIKHIMLPPSRRDFKDIYVVFELMESDLHQVIKANDDLTREHYQFFLYQLLRALKYIHTGTCYLLVFLALLMTLIFVFNMNYNYYVIDTIEATSCYAIFYVLANFFFLCKSDALKIMCNLIYSFVQLFISLPHKYCLFLKKI